MKFRYVNKNIIFGPPQKSAEEILHDVEKLNNDLIRLTSQIAIAIGDYAKDGIDTLSK